MNGTFTNRTFGVEIEAMLPAGTSRGDLAQALRRAGVQAKADNYHHEVREFWRVTTDGSLGYYLGVEVVSPILQGEAGLEAMRTVFRVMSEFGCTVNVSCGFHVHVGCADLTVAQVSRVAKCYIKFETFFDLIVPPSRRADKNQYVKSNRRWAGQGYDDASANRGIERINGAVANLGQLIYANQQTRYYKLNLQPLLSYKTIEFRQAAGTVDAVKAEAWVRVVTAFVDTAITKAPRARTAPKSLTPSEEAERFFQMFNVDKPTRDYLRARMATLRSRDA